MVKSPAVVVAPGVAETLTRKSGRERRVAMPLPREAVSLEDWERSERGLPPKPKPKVVRTDPVPPKVEGQVKLGDIPEGELLDFSARSKGLRNDAGVIFVFYEFYLKLVDGRTFSGWLPEGEFYQLKRKIPKERIDLLEKIVF